MRAASSPSTSFFRAAGFTSILSRLAYSPSMEGCWASRAMAVFSPMPFTPGMLSEASPIRAFKSMMWMGAKP